MAAASRSGQIAWLVVLAMLIVAPFAGIYPIFIMKALCFAIFACAFNLLLGFTGLLSFGHAAYLGAAAYVTGWLVRSAGWSPELGVLAGVGVGAGLGVVVGLIAIRRQGIYFAMITLALAQMLYFRVSAGARTPVARTAFRAWRAASCSGIVPLDNDLSALFHRAGWSSWPCFSSSFASCTRRSDKC